jgi:hypothetical protein
MALRDYRLWPSNIPRQIAFQDWVQCLDRLFSGNGAYAKPHNHSSEQAAALLPFLNHYNYHRPHFGINGCPRTQGSRETTDRDMTARHSGQDAATTRRGVLFSNFRFFSGKAEICGKKHRSFFEAVGTGPK